MKSQLFWWLLTGACVVWYSTITVYVTIRGASDIRAMLSRLAGLKRDSATTPTED